MGGGIALQRSLDPEFLHPELERASFEAKAVGGPPRPGQDPTRLLQRRQDVGSLGLFERLLRTAFSGGFVDFREGYLQHLAGRQNHGTLDQVLQLANVARPRISQQRIHRCRCDQRDLPVHASATLVGEVGDQQRNVLGSFS